MDIYLASHPYTVFGAVVIVLVLWNYVFKRSQFSHLPLPPGPKGFPIVGSLFGVPHGRVWLVYDDWFKIYGDMVYFKILGQGYLILGSLERTTDLFEKRAVNYSDRPKLPMLIDLMQWQFNMGFLPYGLSWRRHRRSFHQHVHLGVVPKYQPVQLKETHVFLRRLLVTPDDFLYHIRHTFAATIMDIAYGIKVSEANDPYISIAEEAMSGAGEAVTPGAGFKWKAVHWRRVTVDLVDKPFEHVKESLRRGTAVPSVAATLIEALPDENDEDRAEEETLAKDTAAVAYAGGADTSVSAVQFFFLALAMYPEVQRGAQAEINAVVGSNRLPDFNDRQFLPYINAIVKETMRWQLVGPLGLPHVSSSDDKYNGYFIPKGTVVLGNAWRVNITAIHNTVTYMVAWYWTILHDPSIYPSPEEYKSERWLKDGHLNLEIPDPTVAAFGFGRRICPGRYLNDNSLYAMVSLTLSVYNISPPVDD